MKFLDTLYRSICFTPLCGTEEKMQGCIFFQELTPPPLGMIGKDQWKKKLFFLIHLTQLYLFSPLQPKKKLLKNNF